MQQIQNTKLINSFSTPSLQHQQISKLMTTKEILIQDQK